MAEAYIVDAVRTPVGRARRRARRRSTPPTSARTRSRRSIERTGVDPGAVDDVVFGNVDTHRPAGR